LLLNSAAGQPDFAPDDALAARLTQFRPARLNGIGMIRRQTDRLTEWRNRLSSLPGGIQLPRYCFAIDAAY